MMMPSTLPICELNERESRDVEGFQKLRVFGPAGAGKYPTTAVGPVNVFLGVSGPANYPSCAAKARPKCF